MSSQTPPGAFGWCVEKAGFDNRLVCGTVNYFSGFVDPRADVAHIRISVDGASLGLLPVDVERPEFARFFPAAVMGFSGVVYVPEELFGRTLCVEAVTRGGEATPLEEFPLDGRLTGEEKAFRAVHNLPEDLFMHSVVHCVDPASFLTQGKAGARTVEELLAKHGVAMERLGSLLDFGVGCGRVFRWWESLAKRVDCHGSDVNESLVAWCREHLAFGTFGVNGPRPPTAYADGSFDLLYTFSVFTHLARATQQEWLAEFHRILRPGGYALISTSGESWAKHLIAPLTREFRRTGYLEVTGGAEGSNVCSVFQSRDFSVLLFSSHFAVVEFAPAALSACGSQDLYLLRRREEATA